MANEFLGKGWRFPVGVDSTGGVAMSENEQKVEESIMIILRTRKGERLMWPDFGCDLHKMVFETVNVSTLNYIASLVRESLEENEPRAEIIDVIAEAMDNSASGYGVDINIKYKVRSTNNEFNLVYPFYLGNGGQ